MVWIEAGQSSLGGLTGLLALFCAPVMGIKEAIIVSVAAVVLFGGTFMAILRRIRVQDEKRRFADDDNAKLPPSSETHSESARRPDDPSGR